MYCHQQMWDAALRVAEAHDAGSSSTILRQQADALVAQGSLTDAEIIYVQVSPGYALGAPGCMFSHNSQLADSASSSPCDN